MLVLTIFRVLDKNLGMAYSIIVLSDMLFRGGLFGYQVKNKHHLHSRHPAFYLVCGKIVNLFLQCTVVKV
jgi:hypothetical protein